jgi:hypothetical protein
MLLLLLLGRESYTLSNKPTKDDRKKITQTHKKKRIRTSAQVNHLGDRTLLPVANESRISAAFV